MYVCAYFALQRDKMKYSKFTANLGEGHPEQWIHSARYWALLPSSRFHSSTEQMVSTREGDN